MRRVPFLLSAEPPTSLGALVRASDAKFTERLRFALYDYFTSTDQTQTAMLPRNVVMRTIEDAVVDLCETALSFPKFRLEYDKRKFVRCCYRNVWRELLCEWQARLVFALGRLTGEATLPAHSEPWFELPDAWFTKASNQATPAAPISN